MIGIDEQIELFKLIGGELKSKVECVVIGGSAMLFYGAKSATKDSDIVFLSENDRKEFVNAAEKIGFGKTTVIQPIGIKAANYKLKTKAPVVMERKEARLDLFLNEIICFKLSPGILERIKEKHEFEKLIAGIVSPEDIILLKCATDRAGDRKDAFELISKYQINWDVIISESVWQMKNGKKIFPVFLYDFIEELKEDYKAEIPSEVLKKLRKLAEEEMLKALGKKH